MNNLQQQSARKSRDLFIRSAARIEKLGGNLDAVVTGMISAAVEIRMAQYGKPQAIAMLKDIANDLSRDDVDIH